MVYRANNNARCLVYTIETSLCDCILILKAPSGEEKRFGLWDTTTYPLTGGGFVVTDGKTSAKIDETSLFTQSDIDVLICDCRSLGGGGGGPSANVVVTADNTLDTVDITTGREILSGVDSWVVPSGLQSVSYVVIASGNAGVTPTITTGSGTSPLLETERGTFSVIKNQDAEIIAPLTITTSAGDTVVVTFTTT